MIINNKIHCCLWLKVTILIMISQYVPQQFAQQPIDDYSGLMSPQEQSWVANIQMMTLTSSQSYQDDFYNRVICHHF